MHWLKPTIWAQLLAINIWLKLKFLDLGIFANLQPRFDVPWKGWWLACRGAVRYYVAFCWRENRSFYRWLELQLAWLEMEPSDKPLQEPSVINSREALRLNPHVGIIWTNQSFWFLLLNTVLLRDVLVAETTIDLLGLANCLYSDKWHLVAVRWSIFVISPMLQSRTRISNYQWSFCYADPVTVKIKNF